MIRRFALLAAALVVVVPTVALLSTAQAGADVELSFTEHPTNYEAIIGGHMTVNPTSPPGPGDTFVLRGDLLQGSTVIGYDNVKCTVTFNDNEFCDGVFAFAGKGDVFGSALLRGGASASCTQQCPAIFDAAITGGTFSYRNAHGDAHAVNTENAAGDTNWTFDFVTT
jgi:hypothetical protein